jgi:uncharacterized repeat protein (TIGR01451 family)
VRVRVVRFTHPALLSMLALLAGTRPAVAAVSVPLQKWINGGCFTSWCQTGWYSSPAVADLDGDGVTEVIWGSYDTVVLSGATGALRARATNVDRVWPGIAVTDLTGDGSLEIVVGRSSNQLHVYRFQAPSTLNVVWSRNPFVNNCSGNGCEVRTLAVEDLESDGQRDVIVGRASGGDTQQLNAYDANGNQRPGWPARRSGEPGYGWGMYNENVAVADMNGDGYKEVFGPTDTHYITALDRSGNQLPVNPIYTGRSVWAQVGVHVDHAVDVRGYAFCGTEHRPNFADSAPAIADVNGDGVPELIVVGNVYNCGTSPYTDLYHMPFILKLDRTRWSGSGFDWTAIPPPGAGSAPLSEDYNVIESAAPNAVVADLDGDGFMEILYSSYDGKVHAYWLDKTPHGSWPYTVPASGGQDNFRFASEPVVADLDNDGFAEVLFTSWPKKATGGRGHLHILNHLGVELHRVLLPAALGGGYNGGLGAPTLANIDGDADLEVVVGTVASGVVAYDLPNTASARVLWGTGRGSYRRTGALIQPSITIGNATVVEGHSGSINAVFTVTLSAVSDKTVTVSYATANGSASAGVDYTAASGVLTFTPGTLSQPVNVAVLGDFAFEPNETFAVDLSGPTNATILDGQGVGTIVDDDTVPAELSITKTDGLTTASPGQPVTYTIVASNAGPNSVTGATVADVLPASLPGATWTCTGSGGGTCPASGAGNISHPVNLPAGGAVTYTVNGTVGANAQSLSNTASITPPPGVGDTNTANNSATDHDTLVCNAEVPVVPDGRVATAAISGSATAWYGAGLHLGGSYSVEFKNVTGTAGSPGALTVFKGDDGCAPSSTLTTRDTTAIDPGATANTARVSFTASGSEPFYRIRLVNSAGTMGFTFNVAETTLFSPAWSTNASFDTYYSFLNTTGATLNGTLSLLDSAGATVATTPLTVPPGGTASANTSTLGVTRNRVGTARFTHDGPPGAFIGEAAIAGFSLNPPYVQPVKFVSVREAR